MRELGPHNVIDYLISTGRLPQESKSTAEACAWGVSNAVLRINSDCGADFVIKQSRRQLRTKANWFSRLDRIWREMEIINTIVPLLPMGVVPRVLFDDRDNYLFAMEAVQRDHAVWKQLLLQGDVDLSIADRLGDYLAAIHGSTAGDDRVHRQFQDRTIFDELRVDPFYRRIAAVHPTIKSDIEQLIADMFDANVCLVLADFSPKNILVTSDGICLIDFETGHFGDPAFDLGFFCSHLFLKAVLHSERIDCFKQLVERFWQRYVQGVERSNSAGTLQPRSLESRTIRHLAGCMLSRIDGKSTVDYLPNKSTQDLVRSYCQELLQQQTEEMREALDRLEDTLHRRDNRQSD